MNLPACKAHGQRSSSSRCHRKRFLPEAPALTAKLSKPMGRARRERSLRSLRPARCQDGLQVPVAAFVVATCARHHPLRATPLRHRLAADGPPPGAPTCDPLPDSSVWITWQAMPGTGSPVPAARVLPRLASLVENQFTSLADFAPACLTPICPKPPPRHSHRANPWRVFSLRIEKIGLSLGAGVRSSASSPGSLTGKRSTRLFSGLAFRVPPSRALAHFLGYPNAANAPGSRPHGLACSPRRPRLHGRFQTRGLALGPRPPGGFGAPHGGAPHPLRMMQLTPRDLRGRELFSVAPLHCHGTLYCMG